MKLVTITGCLGLIGSYVTRACLAKGWKVYGIDKCTYAANPAALEEFKKNANFTFLKEDIVGLKQIPDCDYVINIAAESHVGNSIIDSSDFIRSNIDGVKNLLDLLRAKPSNVCDRPIFLHFSTDEVYGDRVQGNFLEGDSLSPSNPYAASKAAADMLIKAWSRTYDLDYVVVRPTNNYGVGQYVEKLIPLAVKLLQRQKKIRLHNEGTPIRNWLHARDTASAIVKIVESGVKNEIFNIAGGFEQPNIDTVRKIINCYFNGSPTKIYADWENLVDLSYVREGQDVRYAIDDTKLRQLGWKPETSFDEEICGIVDYYKENFRW